MEQSGVYQIQTRRNADRSCSGNISIRVLGKGLQILVETAKCASIDEAYANLAIEIANSEYDCDWTPPSPFGY